MGHITDPTSGARRSGRERTLDLERIQVTSDLFNLFFQLGDSLHEQVQEAAGRHGMGVAHATLLHALRTPCRMGALANELGYDASHITALVDRLVELGLVERLADPNDRRARLINPTPAGLAVAEEMEREVVEGDEAFIRLSVAECRQIAELLKKAVGEPDD